MTAQYMSDRGLPLVLTDPDPRFPTLTVELYVKWYSLFLVCQCEVIQISFEELEEFRTGGESPFVDHVPNPGAVRRMVEHRRYVLDALAEELIVGRWVLEVSPSRLSF